MCDIDWDIHDAHVICRMLGHPKALAATVSSSFGAGSGRVWVNNVQCHGEEQSILNCRHSGLGNLHSSCTAHSNDAGVICYGVLYYMYNQNACVLS